MEKLTKDDVAEFTWLWSQEFFLETSKGCFIWNDPDYEGDNTIRRVNFSCFAEYCDSIGEGFFGRSKGTHVISAYCGNDVVILEE